MLLDPLGGIVLTNDGNAILREVDVLHPAAKTMIELSRTQDEEVGDGSTSVVVLAGEILSGAVDLLEKQQMHPSLICQGFVMALEDGLAHMEAIATHVDTNDAAAVQQVVDACLDTKFSSRWGGRISRIAVEAVRRVTVTLPNGKKEIDIKRYAKVEKIPGGDLEETRVLDGVMVLLLDCPLEYKKGESQTFVEITKEEEWAKLLEQEEKEVRAMCEDIIASGCNVVFTEKGVSDLAQHFLVKAGISCIRRIRKTDNNRIARITGATIVTRTEEITKQDVGTKCGLFEVKKIEVESVRQYAYSAIATALEVIPRTLAQNCGTNVVRVMTELRSKHAACTPENVVYGIDGETGAITDMTKAQVWDSFAVKQQVFKTAVEA
ncbi:UNVERIFIED_CONTAM: hypothetical protein H355_005477, partial [Colinus virginianus]